MIEEMEQILATVEALLVATFGFPAAEARHRLNLWRAQQTLTVKRLLDREGR